jgi:hypothetical protein
MKFHRGKIADIMVGSRWRVKHVASRNPPPTTGMFDIIGAADGKDAVARCRPPTLGRPSSSASSGSIRLGRTTTST